VPLIPELPSEPEEELKTEYVDYEQVLTTFDPGHIALMKSILDSEELTYFVKGEHSLLIPHSMEPARLMVRTHEAQKARDILKDLEPSSEPFPTDRLSEEPETDGFIEREDAIRPGSRSRAEDDDGATRKMLDEARLFLQEVDQVAFHKPKAGLKLLRRKSRVCHDAIQLGKPLHDRFRTLVLSIKSRMDPDGAPSTLPSVRIIPWEEAPTLGDLVSAAQTLQEEILYMQPSNPRRDAAPLAQIDALSEFAKDQKLVMVVIGDETMVLRKSFILTAGQSLDPRSEEIGQDLYDLATEQGFTAGAM
jgi:hypothetical protein